MINTTLKEKAYQELRKSILSGDLKPGEFATERALSEKLQMSRTPIRSAVERLEVEGLVKYTPNKGIFIMEVSVAKAVDFFDFRMVIESHVVGKLALKPIANQAKSILQKNLDQQKECLETNDYTQFTILDSQFHRELVRIYQNSEIIQAMERLQDKLFQMALQVLRKDNSRIHASYNDHIHIFSAIIKQDPDEAVRELCQHLEFGKRILIF